MEPIPVVCSWDLSLRKCDNTTATQNKSFFAPRAIYWTVTKSGLFIFIVRCKVKHRPPRLKRRRPITTPAVSFPTVGEYLHLAIAVLPLTATDL